MKTDRKYSRIDVCPVTDIRLSDSDINNSGGVCPECGDVSDYSYTHSKKIAGRWSKPSLFERIFKGERSRFLRKDDEDKVMETLRREV